MRVLHVIPSVSSVDGGSSRAMMLMEQSLSAAGVSVTTITTDDDGPGCRLADVNRPAEVHGARRVYVRKWSDSYKFAPALLIWLERHLHDFDVLHVHALFSFSSVAAALMAWRKDVPYVIEPLGTLTNYGMKQRRPIAKRVSLALFERRILERAAAVHFTSEAEFEEAKDLAIPMSGVVIPLGAEAASAQSSVTLLRDYPILGDRTVLLFLSRLDPKKNLEGLLKAFAALDPAKRKLVLLIAGAGEPTYTESLKYLARCLNVDDEVIWFGHVEHDTKAAVFASADIFVLPSLSENFGMAAAEALLAGLPCVLGRGVAIAREIEASGAGLMVDPTPQEIACAVSRLVGDEDLRHSMGEAGKKLAGELFSTSVMAARLISLYEEVAVSSKSKPCNVARHARPMI